MNLSLSGFVLSFSARFQVPRVANVLIHALLALFIQFFLFHTVKWPMLAKNIFDGFRFVSVFVCVTEIDIAAGAGVGWPAAGFK